MYFVTTYKRTIKRRKTGKVETIETYYQTKSLTPLHAHIRATYPGAKTYADVKRVITDFVPGFSLGFVIVSGGKVIAE